jgi:hypothetical protein
MSEIIASTESPTGGYEQVKYSNGASHVYEVATDPETGESKKIHISSDQLVRDMGHEPGSVPEAELGLSGDPGEAGSIEQENNDLRTEIAQLRGELSTQNQELTAQISALTEQIRQLLEHLPPPPSEITQEEPVQQEPPVSVEDEPNLTQEEPETRQPSPQEALDAATADLSANRDRLARITIRRRARSGDGLTESRRADLDAYQEAMDDYQQSFETYLMSRRAVMEADGSTGDTVRMQINLEGFDEQKKFAQREVDINEAIYERTQRDGGLRALQERMLRKWANLSTKRKLLIGLTVGGVTAIAAGPLGLGLAGLAAGSAAKFSLGMLSRGASARNISQKSLEQEVARIDKAHSASQLYLEGPADIDDYIDDTVDSNEQYLNDKVRRAQRRNRLGNVIMLASTAATVYGAAELAGAHNLIPGLGGGTHHEVIPGNGDMSNFHPNSFYGRTPHEAAGNMLDVFRRNGFNVSGDDSTHINALIEAARAHNVPIAIGMKETGHGLARNMVDASQAWGGHLTGNANASGLEGLSSVERWNQMRQLAQGVGISITKGNT